MRYQKNRNALPASDITQRVLELELRAHIHRLIILPPVGQRGKAVVRPGIAHAGGDVKVARQRIAAADRDAQLAFARQRLRCGADIAFRIELDIGLKPRGLVLQRMRAPASSSDSTGSSALLPTASGRSRTCANRATHRG